jgi:hypothetical protein
MNARQSRGISALLLVGGMVLCAPSSTAHARPTTWSITTYYSDASLTTIVGRDREGCLGASHSGQRTAYYTSVDGDCR